MALHRAIKGEKSIFWKVTVPVIKVKVTLEQATKVHRGNIGITLLVL